MTGHGRGKATVAGRQILVELSTVNRKQFELACSLPRGFSEFEPKIRESTAGMIQRGRLNCSVSFESSASKSHRHSIDQEVARIYLRELQGLRRKLRLEDAVTLEQVLRGPGVIREESALEDKEEIWPGIEEALDKALKQLVKMREQEGANLEKEFLRLIFGMKTSVKRVAKLAPTAVERHRTALHKRVSEAGLTVPLDDERLAKEVVLFADRADITEELARLDSHFKQFRQLLKKEEPVGRTLEFLTQELNREINTIGSKANDLEITRLVMDLKGELEKVREQIQNVE